MKFFMAVGNPPYQNVQVGDNTKNPPIYDKFLDAAYKISDKVEMIHPARFLFNAGGTSKEWNRKMLSDPHLKVLHYEKDSKKVFNGTDIKGGIAITYRDLNKNYGAIGIFIPDEQLKAILNKVILKKELYLSSIVYSPVTYKFTQKMHNDFPQIKSMLSEGNEYEVKTNVFEKLKNIVFFEQQKTNTMVQIMGLERTRRKIYWIEKEYLQVCENFDKYKVLLPEANGAGEFGEVLSTPVCVSPQMGHTQSFISIGRFNTKEESENLLAYIKTKFCRAMLGILKITQHTSISAWDYVPLQDFSTKSDINWNVSIKEIDKQLYKKYGLSPEEVEFIESHVQEMN